MDKFNLNTFTLKLAVGTIWLVSIFLFACGIYNIFPFIEYLSKTSTWGILVSIPTLVFAYTIGEATIYLNNSAFFRGSSSYKEIDDFSLLAKTKNEFLIKRYENMEYQFQFFKTCVPTFIFLGASVVWSSIQVLISGVREICIGLGIFTIVFSFIFIRMASKKKAEIKYLIEKQEQPTSLSSTSE
ncbi:hypothetical protein [Tenacibaculum aiptasiae]|uniref:hypothetical protein n=1 Tax=Tenacibaculum aiptasiae TaxID=426481 RepID=UPI003B5B8ABD